MNMYSSRSIFALVILIVVLFHNSCTIEKRRHLSGYHVEWNRSRVKEDKTAHETKSVKKEDEQSLTSELAESKEISVEYKLEASLDDRLSFNDEKEYLKLEEEILVDTELTQEEEKIFHKKVNNRPDDRKVNGLALASFICSLLFIFIVPSIIAIVLGAMAKKEIKQNPSKYKGGWMAEFGFIFGIVMSSIFLMLLILFSLWAGI